MKPINTQDKRFHDGNGRDVLGTIVTADWLNTVQDELVGLIEGFKGQADGSAPNQVYLAIQAALNELGNTKANQSHSHTIGDITGLQAALNSKLEAAQLQTASTAKAGIVRLSSATDSDSETAAATSKAVKLAFDRAVAAHNQAGSKVDKSGDIMTGRLQSPAFVLRQGNEERALLGNSDGDVFLRNTRSNRALQLTNDGELRFGNDTVVRWSHFAANLAENGYQRLPNGLIMQWGIINSRGDTFDAIRYPIAYPTATLTVQATADCLGAVGGMVVLSAHVGSVSRTGCNVGISENGVAAVLRIRWFAIGH